MCLIAVVIWFGSLLLSETRDIAKEQARFSNRLTRVETKLELIQKRRGIAGGETPEQEPP
jgi:hypothetical protein